MNFYASDFDGDLRNDSGFLEAQLLHKPLRNQILWATSIYDELTVQVMADGPYTKKPPKSTN